MTISYGVTTGHVLKVHDDDGQGRVLVSMDRLATDGQAPEGTWAPVATLMTGANRGSWFMPEVGDEVLIAFDHGDVNHPYVVGYLWNGRQKPPTDGGIDESTRRLQSVAGHVLEFHDKDGDRRVHLASKSGHALTLDDQSSSVTLVSAGKHRLELDDRAGQVQLQTSSGVSITMDASGIKISAPTGAVTVEATSISLQGNSSIGITTPGALSISAGTLDVVSALSSFEGVVQTTTIIAEAVVGAAYTPAPGDRLGL